VVERIAKSELVLDAHTASVLNDFVTLNGEIAAELLDANGDRYLDYKVTFLRALDADQFSALQKQLSPFGFVEREGEDLVDAYDTYRGLAAAGYDPDAVFAFFETNAAWMLTHYSWMLPQLLPVFGSETVLFDFLDSCGYGKDHQVEGQYWVVRFLFSFLRKAGTPLPPEEWRDYCAALTAIRRSLPRYHDLENATRVAEALNLDWRKCVTTAGFADELAAKLNAYSSTYEDGEWDKQPFCHLNAWVNAVYEWEKEKFHRTNFLSAFAAKISDKALLHMVSLNYDGELMTLVFDALWAKKRVASPTAWLEANDPNGEYRARFFRSMSTLDRVKIFAGEVDPALRDNLERFERRTDNVTPYAITISHFLKELLPDASGEQKKRVAALLLEFHASAENPEVKSALAFWIKYFTPRFDLDTYVPELAAVAAALPPYFSTSIPREEWLADGKLACRSEFFLDSDYADDPNEKCHGQLWFEYTIELMRERYHWRVAATDLDTAPKTCVLRKSVNGVTLETVLTLGYPPRDGATTSSPHEWPEEIIAHRGHGNTLPAAFPKGAPAGEPQRTGKKIFYLGGCKSMGFVKNDGFLETYGDDIVIADTDVSRGETSVEYLDLLMTNIASGKTGWDEYRRFQNTYKIVTPDDPMMLVLRYMKP
jgi:hypothetical protein